ncbi:MAG: hypothetical protein HY593_06195, partial [Candidatus Omnitrophica bacterium]|nr:hypothetical protein [Candidatus Omnitrophota bacterium]
MRDGVGLQLKLRTTQRSRKRFVLRFVSLAVTTAFLCQEAAFGVVDLSAPSQVDLRSFSVPKNIGLVKEANQTSSRETIINVKDIHDNFNAQESIVHILENLIANYNVKTIGIEGMEGPIDTSLLAAFPYEDMKRNTANYLMQAGKLSAGEFLSAMTSGKVAVYGMDDNELYEENLRDFKRNLEKKKENFSRIEKLLAALERFEKAVYSEELRELNQNGVSNNNDGIKFSERWKIISGFADKYRIPYASYANIGSLLGSIAAEKGIDFEKANREREALLESLSKALPREKLETLVAESVAYKLGKISQGAFSSYLLDLARSEGVDLSAYPHLVRYTDYMTLYESIDIDALKDEVLQLEEKIRERLFRSKEERELHQLVRQAQVIRDLFEVKLSSGGLAYYRQHRDEFKLETFKKFLEEKGKRYGVFWWEGGELEAIFRDIPESIRFYDSAEKRNEALLNNTVKQMRENGQTTACLVTGGFHSKGITELLKGNHTSYIVILPRFNKKAKRPYLTLITNSEASFRKFAESEEVLRTKLEMTAHFFAQVAFKAIEKTPYENDAEKNERMQREVARARELYGKRYKEVSGSPSPNLPHKGGGTGPKGGGIASSIAPLPLWEGRGAGEAEGESSLAARSYLLGGAVADTMEVVYAGKDQLLFHFNVNGESFLVTAVFVDGKEVQIRKEIVKGEEALKIFREAKEKAESKELTKAPIEQRDKIQLLYSRVESRLAELRKARAAVTEKDKLEVVQSLIRQLGLVGMVTAETVKTVNDFETEAGFFEEAIKSFHEKETVNAEALSGVRSKFDKTYVRL